MDYKISGYADNKTFAQEAKDAINLGENEEQYIISLNDGAERLSTYIYPNREFGYGFLDIYNTFESLRSTQ